MDLEIANIWEGEVEYFIGGTNYLVEYWLDFSHSEGGKTLDPRNYSYIEYYELDFGDEVLVDTERYEKFKPTTDVYTRLKNAIQAKNFHIQVI